MALKTLEEMRKKLDDIMCQCIGKRISMYGYNRTSRFIKWYAKYYHNIDIDYVIDPDGSSGKSFEHGFFSPLVFKYDYKDVNASVLWMTEVVTEDHLTYLDQIGFVKNQTWFDFYETIYDGDYVSECTEQDPFKKKKSGQRDIQFLEFLEWKFDCNFVEFVGCGSYVDGNANLSHGAPSMVTTQRELFPVLDQLRVNLSDEDAIFDFGCGKGGALVSFVDYGFKKVGGVEYESGIYNVLEDNIRKLNLRQMNQIETYCCDATTLTTELDGYNYFFLFNSFDASICEKVFAEICNSMDRKKRKVRLVLLYPTAWKEALDTGRFRLIAQMGVDMYQRVVDIFESI